jgi:hypothetical protein
MAWEALALITGSLLFTCGTEPGSGNVYFKDDADVVHQLTVTDPLEGADDVTWHGHRILAVIHRGFRGRMEIRDLSTPPAKVGTRLGEGYSPVVWPGGAITYVHIRGEDANGRLTSEVVRRRDGRREVVWQRHEIWDLFRLGRRLFAYAETRDGSDTLVEVNRRPRRSVPLGRRVYRVAISRQGRVAYSNGRGGRPRRLTVMRLDGTHRRHFARAWTPLEWSPDGRRILASGPGRTIGLVNPRTGKVRRLGKLPCGYLTSAEWTRPGEHLWPGDPR